MCARRCELGCEGCAATVGEDGTPNTGDESTCEDTCRRVEESGFVALNVECMQQATSCQAMDVCSQWQPEEHP